MSLSAKLTPNWQAVDDSGIKELWEGLTAMDPSNKSLQDFAKALQSHFEVEQPTPCMCPLCL